MPPFIVNRAVMFQKATNHFTVSITRRSGTSILFGWKNLYSSKG